jgi:hypothetical protein
VTRPAGGSGAVIVAVLVALAAAVLAFRILYVWVT